MKNILAKIKPRHLVCTVWSRGQTSRTSIIIYRTVEFVWFFAVTFSTSFNLESDKIIIYCFFFFPNHCQAWKYVHKNNTKPKCYHI